MMGGKQEAHHEHGGGWFHNHNAHREVPTGDALDALAARARKCLGDAAAAADVDAALRRGGEEGLTDAQVKRWLAARHYDPEHAARDLAAHAEWRAAFAPRGRVLDGEVPNDVAQRKAFVLGPNRAGRGVVVFIGGRHFPRRDQGEIQRFFCYAADAAIALADRRLNPGGRVLFVFMAGSFGYKNFDVSGLTMLFRMVHTHYVERLETMYIAQCSAAFEVLYRIVSACVDPATRTKVRLLPRDDAAAAAQLERELGTAAIAPLLSGAAPDPDGALRPIEEVWPLLEQPAGDGPWALPPGRCLGHHDWADEGGGEGDDAGLAAAAVLTEDEYHDAASEEHAHWKEDEEDEAGEDEAEEDAQPGGLRDGGGGGGGPEARREARVTRRFALLRIGSKKALRGAHANGAADAGNGAPVGAAAVVARAR